MAVSETEGDAPKRNRVLPPDSGSPHGSDGQDHVVEGKIGLELLFSRVGLSVETTIYTGLENIVDEQRHSTSRVTEH